MNIDFLKKQVGLNKTFLLNISSTILLQGIAFFTIPIFTRLLGTEQYGMYAIFNSWVSIFSIIMPLGLGSSIASGKYYFKNEYFDFRNNIVFFNLVCSILIIIFFLLSFSLVNNLLEYGMKLYFVLLLTSFTTNIVGCISGILVYEKKALLNFVLSIILSVLNVAISLYLIHSFKFDNIYEGRVYGHFISYLLVSLLSLYYIFHSKVLNIDFKYFMYGLIVGGPVVFHQLGNYILSQSDRIMMQKMNISNVDIGIYSLYYSFCGVVAIISGALNISFSPFYIDYIDQNDKKNIITKSKNFIELFTIICIGFILLSREVSYIMADERFYSGINLIPIFVVSFYFIFMYQFAVNYEFYYRKTKIIAGATIGAATINVVLNLCLIRIMGIYGAAYATLIAYGVLFLFHYVVAKCLKHKRFYIKFSDFVCWLAFLALFSVLFYVLYDKIYVRWFIGFLLGLYELIRIINRKSIF